MVVMIGNILVMCLLIYYISYFTNLFIFGKHKDLKQSNIQLDSLRKKTVKTLAEQKAFLDIKYPKNPKKKKTFKEWLFIFLFIAYIIIIAIIIGYIFRRLDIKINFWAGLIFVSTIPFFINLILSRFNLHNNDLVQILRGKYGK